MEMDEGWTHNFHLNEHNSSMNADGEEPSEYEYDELFWNQVIYVRRQNASDEQLEADRYDDSYEQV